MLIRSIRKNYMNQNLLSTLENEANLSRVRIQKYTQTTPNKTIMDKGSCLFSHILVNFYSELLKHCSLHFIKEERNRLTKIISYTDKDKTINLPPCRLPPLTINKDVMYGILYAVKTIQHMNKNTFPLSTTPPKALKTSLWDAFKQELGYNVDNNQMCLSAAKTVLDALESYVQNVYTCLTAPGTNVQATVH